MRGSSAKRGTHGLRKRCPKCKKLRKFCEPPGDQGGEVHPRRKRWKKIGDNWICGWCAEQGSTTSSCSRAGTIGGSG